MLTEMAVCQKEIVNTAVSLHRKSRLLLFLFWITTNLISCKMYLTI